jgi:hypothetical protein
MKKGFVDGGVSKAAQKYFNIDQLRNAMGIEIY